MMLCHRCDAPTRMLDRAGRCPDCRPGDRAADREAREHRREAEHARRRADRTRDLYRRQNFRRLAAHHERQADWLTPQADGHP